MRIPQHIGIIPDGNRRWALARGMRKEKGYEMGLGPGLELFRLARKAGIKELSYYGFTTDNTKRPSIQRKSFTRACINAVEMLFHEEASLLVVGNYESLMFPKELLPFRQRQTFGSGGIKVNFLVNYDWQWDLENIKNHSDVKARHFLSSLHSREISKIDLVIRWGGRRRLSGFLPAQTVYADFYVIDEYWPDFKPQHFYDALKWYNTQDITLGG